MSSEKQRKTPAARKNGRQGAAERIAAVPPSRNDPQGSYTGKPVHPGEQPVQDADDL